MAKKRNQFGNYYYESIKRHSHNTKLFRQIWSRCILPATILSSNKLEINYGNQFITSKIWDGI